QRLLSNQRVRTGRTGMDLIIDQMVQFKVVHDTDSYAVIKFFTGSSIVQDHLTVFGDACFTLHRADIFLVRTVEYRGHDLPAKCLCSITEVDFQYLPDV